MNLEINTTNTKTQEIPVRFTRRAKALAWAAGVGMTAGAVGMAAEANTPDFHGDKTVTITEDTVTDIAMDHVDGAEKDVRATVDKIVDMNPEVFQDGKAFVGSEDVGEQIKVPKSVD